MQAVVDEAKFQLFEAPASSVIVPTAKALVVVSLMEGSYSTATSMTFISNSENDLLL